tara:strand:- start:928 stop:1374 length:447 start_codon:yes stop_codon:yes gene_type:complete
MIIVVSLLLINNNHQEKPVVLNKNDFDSMISKNLSEDLAGYKIQVSIENGCGKYGIAKLYTNFLRKNGYDVIDFKNSDNFDYKNTQLIFHKRDYSIYANEIIDLLKINPNFVQYNHSENNYYQITLILGQDYNKIDSYKLVSKFYEPF